ncbi:MAG: Mrp/NBP35 family ATP-binding protein [Candidatus Cloacimonetes bacterium]|nr:Mrp/NBP35 family ATP-binding protein [Candidatus Cloacimonadota bacterium]MDY0367301.1 Mrp/NBP35 family ATP-binding protein [Candidatus Syntrophosphaera sp.]HOY84599.1 Mrp/NBP35 family ATP-binding protein [Candidatus Syntrophosphaera sp.]HPH61608.1 Mrp/NBP35 family ATP-binding protein [Candidatus Syntrophosphaera sp.]
METNKNAETEVDLSGIKHRIMVMSGKGGVGKSTIAVNLAYGLALAGKKVGLLDADLHGPSVAKMTGSEGARASGNAEGKILPVRLHDNFLALSIAYLIENADSALIWRGPLKMSALKDMIQNTEWGELDYLIIDCPPGTGDEPLSVVQLLGRVDGAVVVSSAQDVALLDVRKNLDFAKKLGVPVLGLIENMSWIACPHCGEKVELFGGEGIAKALMDYDVDLLAKLPFDSNITSSCDGGRPFIYEFGKTPSAQILQDFVQGVITKTEG